MALPAITDGTVVLRPFSADDGPEAVAWLSGPHSRDRSATDGGPSLDEDNARRLVEKLCHSDAYAVVIDDAICGSVSLHRDGKSCGWLEVVLSQARLWVQGVGSRVVRLMQRVAFEQEELEELAVAGVPESAEGARVCYEDAGFAMVARRRSDENDEVLVDFRLDALSWRSAEQRIIFVHHGRTGPEADQLLLGSTMDPPLDHVGRAQAEALSLSGLLYGIGECMSSPALRAQATAEQAFAAHNIPMAVTEEWQDRNWGSLSGQCFAQVERDAEGLIIDPPTGESEAELRARVKASLQHIPYGEHVAIVTHGAVIAAVLRYLQPNLIAGGGLASGMGISHGSITELRRGPVGWRVIRISDDRHQQARRATAESA
ncbi:MAG: GNAT family N-acetyltransferase [Planctomycetota bacterium]|nr:MAG: GNAT family N-acetyltransferase [Planctomycetota bacterium]